MRCAFCHEDLSPSLAKICSDCGTAMHPECGEDLARCPTLGCESQSFASPTRAPSKAFGPRPLDPPSRWRRAFWIVFGLLAPAAAFLADAALRVDPLIWGAPHFFPEPESGYFPTLRQVVVCSAVFGSMVGLVLFMRGKTRASVPLLALGIALCAAHAAVFVPLVPISAVASLLGIGLLGFSPFLALAVYVDAYRRAQRSQPKAVPADDFWLGSQRKSARRALLVVTPLALLAIHWFFPAPIHFPAPAKRHLEGVAMEELRSGVHELLADTSAHDERGVVKRVPPSLEQVAEGAQVHVGGEKDYVRFHWDGKAKKSSGYPYGYFLYVLTKGQELPPAGGTCYRSVEIAPGVWSQYLKKGEPPGGGPAFVRYTGP